MVLLGGGYGVSIGGCIGVARSLLWCCWLVAMVLLVSCYGCGSAPGGCGSAAGGCYVPSGFCCMFVYSIPNWFGCGVLWWLVRCPKLLLHFSNSLCCRELS